MTIASFDDAVGFDDPAVGFDGDRTDTGTGGSGSRWWFSWPKKKPKVISPNRKRDLEAVVALLASEE